MEVERSGREWKKVKALFHVKLDLSTRRSVAIKMAILKTACGATVIREGVC
ncbi:MAG: hypothetical protein ACI4U2_05015 [Christensenellaceae bacterium]